MALGLHSTEQRLEEKKKNAGKFPKQSTYSLAMQECKTCRQQIQFLGRKSSK